MIPANLSSFVRGAQLSDLDVRDQLNLRIVRALASAKREMSDAGAREQCVHRRSRSSDTETCSSSAVCRPYRCSYSSSYH